MAKFHGKTNLHLGEPAWATSVYDHDSHDYVIDVSDEDADRFRDVADEYGFVENDEPEPDQHADEVDDDSGDVDPDGDVSDEDAESV